MHPRVHYRPASCGLQLSFQWPCPPEVQTCTGTCVTQTEQERIPKKVLQQTDTLQHRYICSIHLETTPYSNHFVRVNAKETSTSARKANKELGLAKTRIATTSSTLSSQSCVSSSDKLFGSKYLYDSATWFSWAMMSPHVVLSYNTKHAIYHPFLFRRTAVLRLLHSEPVWAE